MGLKQSIHRRRGMALIELALVLPLLAMLLFGLMEYGWVFLSEIEIKNAARNAARIGVNADSAAGDITSAVTTYMSASGLGASGYTVTVSANPASLNIGDPLTVHIALPYANIALFNMTLFPTPTVLQASVTMAKEGP